MLNKKLQSCNRKVVKSIRINLNYLVVRFLESCVYARQMGVLVILTTLLFLSTSILLPFKYVEAGIHSSSYTLGVFPYMPPQELDKVYGPIAAEISRATNSKVIFKSSSTFEIFMGHLDAQAFDIAFVQPFDYVRIADNHGYKPLAARGEPLATVFVVKQNSPINGLSELRGKKLGFPPAVAAVSYLGKAYLMNQDMNLDTDVTVSHFISHFSCLQKVVIGSIDVCGTSGGMIRYFQHRMKVKLKIIGESTSIPHALFTVHPRVPTEDQKKILDVILSWSKTDKGKAMLARTKLAPFSPVTNKAYDVVREFRKTLNQ